MRIVKGLSLFSSAGIGETFFKDIGLEIVAANELVEKRANLYQSIYKDTKMIPGDITEKVIFEKVLEAAGKKVGFLLASPPCQGLSVAGKNRDVESMVKDERNYLINYVIKIIHKKKPTYILIENVPSLFKLLLPYKGRLIHVHDILFNEFKDKYIIQPEIIDSADFGVPQTRSRAIIKMFKKGSHWGWPTKVKKISVREAIGQLPSLESGEVSDIKWHYARKHDERHILWMKHTMQQL